MSNLRDDFSEATKRNAALRVGYRCSFKDCNCPTVGASMESKDKSSSIGVAAHICAAAPGGPRYDETMTQEERKDISNCIWMCQTHAHLIDTDEKKYTVELLREWKTNAEQAASEALANPNFFSNCYATNPDNFDTIQQIFENLIIEGDYKQLCDLLNQYTWGQLSDKYDEFVLRFIIIYEAYCDRASLKESIAKYISIPLKYGIDELLELFIALSMNNELEQLVKFSDNDILKQYAQIIIDGKGKADQLYSFISQPGYVMTEKYKRLIYKAATNDIALNLKRNIVLTDGNGKECGLFRQEFYYNVIASIYGIAIRGIDEIDTDINTDSDFLVIERNLKIISTLDTDIQEYIWANLLWRLSSYKSLFDKYYTLCPEALKSNDPILKARFIYSAQHDPKSITIDDVVTLSERTGDYNVLSLVLTSKDWSESKQYLDDHRYLLSKSIKLLFDRIIIFNELTNNEIIALLNNYSTAYSTDFLYHCMRAKFFNDEATIELTWLENNLEELELSNVLFYCSVLDQHHQWEQLYSLSKRNLPHRYLYNIATILANSLEPDNLSKSKELMDSLIALGYKVKGIKHNLGIINQNLGLIGTAKKLLQEEYDEFHEVSTLKQFLSIRYNSDDYIEDRYLLALINVLDPESQNLVGATYLKLQKPQIAYKYFIRALLMDNNQFGSINGLCQISGFFPKVEDCNSINKDTVCTLLKSQNSIKIAIHSPDILEGIAPNQFANCEHYSVEDPRVSSLLFRSKGETVKCDGGDYVITSITPSYEEFFRYAFFVLTQRQDTKKIISSTVEESVEEITSILKSSSEELKRIIDNYNKSELRIPVSALARQVGKSMLSTCEFLAFENQENIRNNLAYITDYLSDSSAFVLSYDSIVLLSHLHIDLGLLDGMKLVCSKTVKNQLNNDINEELSALSSDRNFGSMSYSDGGIRFIEYTPESRRIRHTYLNDLKSFLGKIKTVDSDYDYSPHNQTWKEPFTKLILESKLLCESSSLGLVQNIDNAILVTDDQIIYNIASVENIKNIGIEGLLTFATSRWEKLLEVSKELQRINFLNYLPIFLYQKIVESIAEDTEHSQAGNEKTIEWLLSDTDAVPSQHHDHVVIALFREIINNPELFYLHSDPLRTIALKAFDRQNPGLIAKQIKSALSELRIDPIEDMSEQNELE